MAKLRILQIVPTLGAGGISAVVRNYYQFIDKDRFVFDFITHGAREEFHKDLEESGARIYYVGSIPENGLLLYIKKVKKIFREGHYDIIHFHVRRIRWVLLPVAKKYAKYAVFTHAHSTSPGSFAKFWAWWASKWTTLFLSCGEDAGNAIYCGRKFAVLPNAIDIERFTTVTASEIEAVRNEFNISKGEIILGTVGAINEQKNQSFLIELAKKLEEKNFIFKLLIVGDGYLKEDLSNKIQKYNIRNVVFLTGVRNDVNILMNAIDFFLLPSLYEGFPVVAVEAQVAGCHCLLSENITRHCNIGIEEPVFLPLNNIDSWIEEITKTNYRRTDIEKRLEKLEKSDYSLKNAAKILENIYYQYSK